MNSFRYLIVYIYSQYNLETLDYIAYSYQNFSKFNDSKPIISKIMKITKYCGCIDVVFKILVVLGTTKN